MNTRIPKVLAPLAGIALLLASSSAFIAACSSDNSASPGPTPHDSGSGGGQDTGTGGRDAGSPNDSGNVPDVDPNCHSDAARCNSCVTPQQDPYHACSSATANCVKFDNATRVPANVPPVP